MTKEEMIKQTADGFELPVEQVALIWSVVEYMTQDAYAYDQNTWKYVEEFINEKF